MSTLTTVAAVEQHLGRTLTGTQAIEVDGLLTAADAWVFSQLPYSYPQTALLTGERHTVEGPYLFLRRAPIASVTSVEVRSPSVGATVSALVAETGYELLNATSGLLRIADYLGWEALVTYTPAIPIDPRLNFAATRLIAFWLRPLLEGVSGDVSEYALGQEIRVKFRDPVNRLGVPDDVVALVESVARVARGLVLA